MNFCIALTAAPGLAPGLSSAAVGLAGCPPWRLFTIQYIPATKPTITTADSTVASQIGNPKDPDFCGCRGNGAGAGGAGGRSGSIGGARGLISGGASCGATAAGSRRATVEGGGAAVATGCGFLVQSGHSV